MRNKKLAALLSLLLGAPATLAFAQEPATPDQSDMQRKLDVLTEEVQKLKSDLVLPETPALKSQYGLGPAASKVYNSTGGLSIGGYGEAYYQNLVSDKNGGNDKADMYRVVLYTGYRFSDNILFNSEIEFEHGGDEVAVEFAYLDFLLNPAFNARAGMVLIPMGITNEYHEPVFFNSVRRPQVEQTIIPTTWSEMGVGAFGQIAPGLTYKAFVVNSLNAKGFSKSGIREGRQGGDEARAESFAFVGNLEYSPMLGMTLGGSVYTGNSGQGQTFNGQEVDGRLNMYELHGVWQYRGLQVKALGVKGTIGDAAAISADVGSTVPTDFYGMYGEVGYDVMPMIKADSTQSVIPFVRYERYNTQDEVPAGLPRDLNKDVQLWVAGVNYKPHPQVAIKADYSNFSPEAGTTADTVNLGVAFVF